MSKVQGKIQRINDQTMKEEITDEICECGHPGTAHIEYGHGVCQRKGCFPKCKKFRRKNEKMPNM